MGNLSNVKVDGTDKYGVADIELFLESKGIEFTRSGDWLKMNCILPGHNDSSPSFFIHRLHHNYNCYVCGSGNFTQLCEQMGWEINIESINVDCVPDSIWKDVKEKIKNIEYEPDKKKEQSKPAPKGLKKITSSEINCKKHYQYMADRNIESLIDMFNVGYVVKGDKNYSLNYINRIIIPCHDSDGKYMWCEGRAITHIKVDRKYFRPFGINKTKYLFNYHRVKKSGYDYIVVVEGIIDAMILWSWDIPGVCCFGSNISDEQISLLAVYNKVYVCLDNDAAGIKGWVTAKKRLKDIGIALNRIILPKNKDINNITENHFRTLLKKSKKIV